jgi:hypothetical protein
MFGMNVISAWCKIVTALLICSLDKFDTQNFVRLGAVVELQKIYSEISDQYTKAKEKLAVVTTLSSEQDAAHVEFRYCIGRKQAFERVIRLLELPIEIPIGA